MPPADRCDVLVIGGGPAGSTMASLLARRGYAVTVLEKERFPREHVGESMLPFCYHIFEELGVLDEIEHRFVRKPGVRFIDVDGEGTTSWCFKHHIKDGSALSFQVIRSEFDQLLLSHAQTLGATVHEDTRVVDAAFGPDDVTVTAVGPSGCSRMFEARFLVDASGRETFVSNRRGTKVADKELERTALSCSHWKGATFEGSLAEGVIQIVYLGGTKQGWIWCIPLGTDRLSVGVVMNTSYYRKQRALLRSDGIQDWRRALYLRETDGSPYVKKILEGATMQRELQVNGDYSYVCQEKWGSDFALVGDASAFIDPIFSTGVFMAMNSSRLVSAAVDICLREGSEAGATAFTMAYESIGGAYELIQKLIRLFYAPESINFAQLGAAADAFTNFDHYRNAMSVFHFLIAGDFYDRSETYNGFIETLRDPKTFRRYQRLVLDRPTLNTPSCEIPYEVAFHPNLKAHEARRMIEGI